MLKGIVLGILLGFVLLFLGAYFYFSTGHAPVATNSPQMPFESQFARMALHAYLNKAPHVNSPVPVDEANLSAAANLYKQNCAVCHGLLGEPHNAIGHGMFPRPPLLFRGVGVTDDEPWEIFTIMSGGIRMTGMPGFKDSLSDTQMWQLAQLLKNADKLPDSVKAVLSSTPPSAAPGQPSAPAPMAAPANASEPDHDHAH